MQGEAGVKLAVAGVIEEHGVAGLRLAQEPDEGAPRLGAGDVSQRRHGLEAAERRVGQHFGQAVDVVHRAVQLGERRVGFVRRVAHEERAARHRYARGAMSRPSLGTQVECGI